MHLREFFLIKMGVNSCKICLKDFAGPVSLRIHERIHGIETEKPEKVERLGVSENSTTTEEAIESVNPQILEKSEKTQHDLYY